MKIKHEVVQPVPHLPFKFYEHTPLTDINVAPHWHQGIEINYLIAGDSLYFTESGHTSKFDPGSLWAVNRRLVHSVSGNPKAAWDEIGLIIDDDFLRSQCPESTQWQIHLNGKPNSASNTTAYHHIAIHLTEIRQLLHQPTSDLLRLRILSHFFAILAELGDHFVTKNPNSTTPNQTLVDQVMSQINERYAENLTGPTLSKQFHVSLTTLNQQFNNSVQSPINQYIRLVRLMHAQDALLNTDNKVDYIATSCGFLDAKSLNRNFKSWKSITPTAYRQKYRQNHSIDTSCF